MVICLNCGALMIGGGRYEGVEELDEDDDWRIEPAVLHWYEACTLNNARLRFTYIFDARICMLSGAVPQAGNRPGFHCRMRLHRRSVCLPLRDHGRLPCEWPLFVVVDVP